MSMNETGLQPRPSWDPITGPIEAAIECADEHQVFRILRVNIPNAKGITDEERLRLVRLAEARFTTLRESQRAPGPMEFKNGRWAPGAPGKSLQTSEETTKQNGHRR